MRIINTQHKKKYAVVTFENDRSFIIDPALLKKFNAGEDDDVDMMTLLDENEDFAYDFALNHAFRLLGISAKTYKEMQNKLYEKHIQTNAVKRVMDRLTELGYINDRSYAEDYVGYKMESYHSKHAIINKLREKGVSEDIINECMEIYSDEDENRFAEYFALKIAEKYPSLDYEKLKNKVFSRLSSKGFSTASIYYASGKMKEGYNSSHSDKDTIMRTAARMSMRGMNKEEIYETLIKKDNSKDYDELLNDILNELFL